MSMGLIHEFAESFMQKGLSVEFNTKSGTRIYHSFDLKRTEDGIELTKTVDGKCVVKMVARLTQRTMLCTVNAVADEGFVTNDSIIIRWNDLEDPDEIRINYMEYTSFTLSMACNGFDDIHRKTLSLLARYGNIHCHMFALCCDSFKAWLGKRQIRLTVGTSGERTLEGAFLTVSVADDPFVAIDNNFKDARAMGGIKVPLKNERPVTKDKFSGFGWCSWNAFEQQVTSQKVYSKLEELVSLGIPVEWVLIDDGWMQYTDDKELVSFKEDGKKIPEGMKSFVAKVKSYGVKHVGLWHATSGYWHGIADGSPAYMEQKENLIRTAGGMIIPSFEPEKGYAFWDNWYGYLADCGIDFVKIDSQSSFAVDEVKEMGIPIGRIMVDVYGCMERAAQKHFGGDILNCGMDVYNLLLRPSSLIARNGEDFWPVGSDPRGSFNYLMHQNVYNSLYHDKLYLCDYDMWWSTDATAQSAAVLRSISGSVNYISDRAEGFNKELIMKTLDEDGKALFCDHACYPTADCLYKGCGTSILKMWNKSGDCFGAAAFNIGGVKERDVLRLAAIHGMDASGEYIVYEYFTKSFVRADVNTELEIELDLDDKRIWSIYPIKKDEDGEYIMLGNTDKFLPIPSKFKKKTYLKDIM